MSRKGFVVQPQTTVYTTGPAGAGGAHNTVVVQQAPPVVVQQRQGLFGQFGSSLDRLGSEVGRDLLKGTNWTINQINKSLETTAQSNVMRGLFGQLGHELNLLGRTVSREVDWTADQINRSLATTAQSNVLSLFQSGNAIQLVSRACGRTLEIVMGPGGGLVVDGLGPDGAPHATWTIVNEGGNQVRLHNNNNFLAIINGATVLIPMPPGTVHGIETKFQMTCMGQFIHLESMKERNRYIAILPNGQLKAALASGRDQHSQFGVRLLHSPYGVSK